MLAHQSHWSQHPSSDYFGDLRNPAGYENSSLSTGGHDYYYSQSSSSQNTSKSRSSKTMPSKSRRSSTVDGDYEWDEPEQDHKKSRSKLPAGDKLVVNQCLHNYPATITNKNLETSRPEPCLTTGIQAEKRKAHQGTRGQSRRVRKPP